MGRLPAWSASSWETKIHRTSAAGFIATGAFSGNVRVWSTDGTLVADIPVQLGGQSPAVTFVPGTDTLFYEDGGGVMRRFTPDTNELTELARSVLTRGFTPDECVRYFPGERCPTFET